jgi:hypothetical protein
MNKDDLLHHAEVLEGLYGQTTEATEALEAAAKILRAVANAEPVASVYTEAMTFPDVQLKMYPGFSLRDEPYLLYRHPLEPE